MFIVMKNIIPTYIGIHYLDTLLYYKLGTFKMLTPYK